MNEKRTITILFSRYTDITSKFIYLISGRGYTHVSISLDENNEYFYSFNKKGFRKEYPKKHLRLVKSVSYKIQVSEEEYNNIKTKIEEFNSMKDSLKYSLFGVLFCFLHIKFKFKNKYFCSQFVAEILEEIEDFHLGKDHSLYFPNDLYLLVQNFLPIKEINYNPFIEGSL